jgi:hypothetical protein
VFYVQGTMRKALRLQWKQRQTFRGEDGEDGVLRLTRNFTGVSNWTGNLSLDFSLFVDFVGS